MKTNLFKFLVIAIAVILIIGAASNVNAQDHLSQFVLYARSVLTVV